ncbi:hypothetical protein [Brevibacterium permense]|uniref:Minor tail protein n=1 Tax=Brevibacterium permense TaxID=234834 RepID=A0ABN2A8T8_9MICO|nr:hypothetical protein [Brevibacterium permense]
MSLDRLYRDVENLKQQYKGLAGGPQLALSSIENGAIDSMDADGNLKMTIGQQDDGGNTINVISGPTPPTPVGFTVDVDHGKFIVHWSGDFDGDKLAPSDWSRAEVHASQDPFFVPSRATARGSIVSAAGGEVTIGVLKGPWTIKMLAWSQAGKMSAPSAPVTVDVPGYGDIVLAEIDAAETVIKNAGEVLVTEQGTLDEKLSEVDGSLNDLGQDLQAVEDAQAQLNTDLTDVMTSVDGKNTITWDPSAPSAVSNPGKAVGDLWYRTSGNNIVGFWKWDGTDWVTQLLDVTTIPLIDIGAGTFGSLSGSRLDVASVTADKVLIAGSDNLVVNPKFENDAAGWSYNYAAGNTDNFGPMEGVGRSGGAGLVAIGPSGDWYAMSQEVPVEPGEYLMTVWVKSSVDIAPGVEFMLTTIRPLLVNGSQPWMTSPAADRNVGLAAGVWKKIQSVFTVPADGLSTIFRVGSRSGLTSGTLVMSDISVVRRSGATLIENGGITTPKLSADVLEVKNLKATTGQLDEAVINKLFSDVVVAKMAVAEQFIGENAILTGAVTAPKITASEELTAKVAEFLRVRAEMIEADAIDSMVITAPTIQSARSGRRWVASTDSIRVIDSNDDVRTQLSPEGSTFKGEVEADTLVVNEGAEFKANNTLAQGAKLTLAAGVTDPTAPPVVQPYWGRLEFEPVSMNTSAPVGLAWDGTNYITVGSNKADKGVASYYTGVYAMKITGTTGATSQFRCDFSAGAANEQRVSEVFGVTCIGSELFWLGRYGYVGYVWVTDLSGTFLRRFAYPELGYESGGSPLVYKPGIGNDGTNVVIAQCDDAGLLRIRIYNKTTGARTSQLLDNGNTRSDITGVYVGNADWGRKLATVVVDRTSELLSFSPTTGVYDGDGTKFNAAATGSTGVVFVDGKFRTLDSTGVIHEYADSNTGDGSGDWWATYYWYTDVDDDDIIESSDYQSRMAPPARFTWPRRAGLKILGQPMPDGVEALGPALAKKTTTPVRTDFSGPGWQVDVGKPSARYTSLPTNWTTYASPSATNTFPEAESSVLESASGTFLVRGDGSGHWGPLNVGRNGIMSGLIVTGQTVCKVDTAGTPKKFTVQLPAGRFTKPPVVWATNSTTVPQDVAIAVRWEDVRTTSFDLWYWRKDLTANGVTWFAMDAE